MTSTVVPISVTTLRDFLTCRRRGRFNSTWGPQTFEGNLFFGIAIHEFLEKYYKSGGSFELASRAYVEYCQKAAQESEKSLGYLWPEAFSEFDDLYRLGWDVVSNYAMFDTEHPLKGSPVAVEKRLFADIQVPGSEDVVRLTGQIDALLRDDQGGLWVVDHKTSARGLDPGACDVDEQLTAYGYLVWRQYGEVPAGVIYNVILKQRPEPPVVLQRGGFSKSKEQRTTSVLYRAALLEADLPAEPYADFLKYLDDTGWEKFFHREIVSRSQTELESFEKYVAFKIQDIHRSLTGSWDEAYPAPSIYQCGYCPFIGPCKAMNDGGDWESILDAKFTRY